MPYTLELLDLATTQALESDPAALALNAMGGGGSPVDFDLTVGIYLVFFFIMFFALKSLLFDPYLAVREKRQQGIGGNREQAETMRRQAAETLAEYESRLEDARNDATRVRNTIRKEGADEQKAILETAYDTAAGELKAHREELEKQVEGARTDMRREAETLSTLIVQRLLP